MLDEARRDDDHPETPFRRWRITRQPMFTGAHVILYSRDAAADRAFLRDVVGFPAVDAGDGWLIFALPPAEVAVHPADGEPGHELYLMCDDVRGQLAELVAGGAEVVAAPSEQRWGVVASIRLPSGAELAIYEPRHPSPTGQDIPGVA